MVDLPPLPTPAEGAELARRRRGRNLALLLALLAVALLFYFITLAKLGLHGAGS